MCESCGLVKDRDLNAAEHLNRAGLARIHACGPDGSVSFPQGNEATSMDKQEAKVCMIISIHIWQSKHEKRRKRYEKVGYWIR